MIKQKTKMTVEKGWIHDGFQITPSISWTWMPVGELSIGERAHQIQFAFLWWYIAFTWIQKVGRRIRQRCGR